MVSSSSKREETTREGGVEGWVSWLLACVGIFGGRVRYINFYTDLNIFQCSFGPDFA